MRAETPQYRQYFASVRTLVPRLLDQHHVLSRATGTRSADDRWVDTFSQTIFRGTPEQAADAAAAALAEGMDPTAIGEAISLAANQLVLRDNGRPRNEAPEQAGRQRPRRFDRRARLRLGERLAQPRPRRQRP